MKTPSFRSRPEIERALLRAGSTASEEEANRFYGERVADFGRTIGVVFGGIYLLGLIAVPLAFPGLFWVVHLHPAKLFNLGLALGGLGISWVARRPGIPSGVLTAFDIGLPLSVSLATAGVAHTVPAEIAAYLLPLLISTIVLVVRAAIVPSPTARTFLIGIASGIPVVYAGWVVATRSQGTTVIPLFVILVGAAALAVAVAFATTNVSRVIYGLQREVQSAKRLGQYVLGDLIGEGGMGAVYRAQHAMLRRPTAVKLLLPERAGPENIARFEREVQLTARLTHPNTVAVYDYGRTPEGVFYYAMEYLDGLSLEELVRRYGPQPEGRVIHILLQATGALLEAHSTGLIHRDVKPANILLCERGGMSDLVKLLDFGLVKSLGTAQSPGLTQANAITGTPLYLAPESVLDPTTVDARVDLYALGAVAYYLLTGRPVFEGRSVLEICGHHLHTVPERPSERLGRPLLPELEELVMRCLDKQRDRRPESALEVQGILERCERLAPFQRADAQAFWRSFRAAEAAPGPEHAPPGQLSDTRTDAL
ncbi:MAG TPA: serine/threonine-protein kinase [Polyangiaceae bacterium]|nr:serine/threonine-protein kinase [Polyangiaceae bacterium]